MLQLSESLLPVDMVSVVRLNVVRLNVVRLNVFRLNGGLVDVSHIHPSLILCEL